MPAPLLLALLVLAVLFIIYGTAKAKLHPFLVLLAAAYGLGLAAGLSPGETVEAITGGFGGTIGYIGIVIAAGTIIGVILEKSGAALVMARAVIGLVGRARASLAMSLTGAVVSVPVFCDSGFVILAPLNRSLAAQSGASLATFAVALSMGLYATHVFVPPTPGPIAAAGELGADVGTVIVLGLLTTIPVLFATNAFAQVMGRRIFIHPDVEASPDVRPEGEVDVRLEAEDGADVRAQAEAETDPAERGQAVRREPRAWKAFAPILLPMALIAVQSVAELPGRPFGEGAAFAFLSFLGDPNTALLLGVCVALLLVRKRGADVYGPWIGEGLREAGVIILITGAGGALGRVLQATPLGDVLGASLAALELGAFSILLPFLIAAALKTALGSSTVAIITTASIVLPLLPALGLDVGLGPALTTLAVGAGAMTVSHANDSYFWVVSQFSDMTVAQAYRLQTLGSAVAGLTGIAVVFVLSLVLL